MTAHRRSRRLAAASICLLLSPVTALAASQPASAQTPAATAGSAAAAGTSTTTATSAVTPTKATPQAAASASDFTFAMHPLSVLGEQACTGPGMDVSDAPFFAADDCGFSSFKLTGTATKVEARLYAEGEGTPFASAPVTGSAGDYDVTLKPTPEWKPGVVRLAVLADGVLAGESTFGYNALEASFTPVKTAKAGEAIPVTGEIVERNTGALRSEDTGVPPRSASG